MANKKEKLTEDEKHQQQVYEQELQEKVLEEYYNEIKRRHIVNLFYVEKSFQEELYTKKEIIKEIQKCKRNLSIYKSDEKSKIKVNDTKLKKEFIKILNNTFEKVYKHIRAVEYTYKDEVAELSKIIKQDAAPENISAVDLKFVQDEFRKRMKKFSFGGIE